MHPLFVRRSALMAVGGVPPDAACVPAALARRLGASARRPARVLGHPAQAMCFVSSNGGDACSARAYGHRVMWCNRFGQPAERIPAAPEGMLSDPNGLPAVLEVA